MANRMLRHACTSNRCGRRNKSTRKIGGICIVCVVANDYERCCSVSSWAGRSSRDVPPTVETREQRGRRNVQRNVLEGAPKLGTAAPLLRGQAKLVQESQGRTKWRVFSSRDVPPTVETREQRGRQNVQRNVLEGAPKLGTAAPLLRAQAKLVQESQGRTKWRVFSSRDVPSTVETRKQRGRQNVQRNVLEGAPRLGNTASLVRQQAKLLLCNHREQGKFIRRFCEGSAARSEQATFRKAARGDRGNEAERNASSAKLSAAWAGAARLISHRSSIIGDAQERKR
jgi:hypothetical protein